MTDIQTISDEQLQAQQLRIAEAVRAACLAVAQESYEEPNGMKLRGP